MTTADAGLLYRVLQCHSLLVKAERLSRLPFVLRHWNAPIGQQASYDLPTMQHLTKKQQHQQCLREIRGTLLVVLLCALWHIGTGFVLDGSGLYFLGMPAWFSVSVLGCTAIAVGGLWYLLRFVFVDFVYDEEKEESKP